MKEIKAYVRNQMVDAVVDALNEKGLVTGIAVVPLREYGHADNTGKLQRIELTKLEMDVADDMAETVVVCILEHARTGPGHPGDGKIYVSDVHRAIRIEDGAEGEQIVREDAHHHRHPDEPDG